MSALRSKPQCWLVFEEGERFDGGMTPLLVAPTEAMALQAKADIEHVVERTRARLARLPDPFAPGISGDEYVARDDRRTQLLERVRWPHRLKRAFWSWEFTVGVMPLPHVQQEAR